MNQRVDEQVERAQTVTWLTEASTIQTWQWCFNLSLALLLLKPETEGTYGLKSWIVLHSGRSFKQLIMMPSHGSQKQTMLLWPWRLHWTQNDDVSHSKAGWYLQQGHFHDQVDEVGQQFLQEILLVCFYTRGRGRDYEMHMADPCWSKIVSFLGASLPWQSPTPSFPSSIFHAECTVEMALMEIS